MIPFLKRKEEATAALGEDEPTKKRMSDHEEEDYGMLEAISEDMLEAMAKKDRDMLRDALDALCEYIQQEMYENEPES